MLVGIAAVIVLLLVGVGIEGLVLWGRVERVDLEPHASPDGGTTYLLVGTDSREFIESEEDLVRYGSPEDNPGTGADVMLLVRVGDEGSTRFLSISRDLVVVDEQTFPLRATAALDSGPQELLDTLCRSLGLGIDHYLQVDFAGLRDLVNAIGGIDVSVDQPTRDIWSGLQLEEGTNHLDGDGVLQYVASRRPEVEVEGEWVPAPQRESRGSKAAEVLGKIGEKLDLAPWRPLSAHRRLSAVAEAITTDSELGMRDAFALRSRLGSLSSDEIVELPTVRLEGSDDFLPIEELEPDAGRVLVEFDGPEPAEGCQPRLARAER